MAKDLLILGQINISPLIDAHKTLKGGMLGVHSQLERDGLIKRFEYTYELSWKTLKKVLAFQGLDINSPRDVFRAAVRNNLIKDPKVWFDFIDKRNLTSHTYNQEYANEVLNILPLFEQEVADLIKTIKNL
jgi:nucleotidyltransferase substrate binding protein (TIGR01987 family)